MVGESGSGKSTLIKTLLGILPVKSGNCFADGREIDISELHHLISYIPQEEYYIKNEGAFYNCQLADETITEERLEVEYEKVFQNHNYFWKDAGNINMLSGGQKETIGILRGLFCNAPVIIMDEPTKSLNVQNRQKLINEINRLSKRSMVIISTHDQEIIQSAGNIINLS
jgi:ABC-type bacteriocin/lantibiotic exporter with double-glycine peptidase domain